MNHIKIKNNEAIKLAEIPVINYSEFLYFNTALLSKEENHCVQYFGFRKNNLLRLICCMADDNQGIINISSSEISIDNNESYPSFSNIHLAFHCFEREIHENFGLNYTDHPWLKPLRFSFDRFNKNSTITNYPFRQIESEELHEVGVGPIHAGIIEPGHFRFICSGEQILHLEIQLGYQHRGIEKLMISKKKLIERNMLAESIAGDTVIGHSIAYANLWESLCDFKPSEDIQFARTIALEWERIANHTGDLSALCNDIAYQLGGSVFGRLRTPIINTFQMWCGNRLGKSAISPGVNNIPFTNTTAATFSKVMYAFQLDFMEMYDKMSSLPSILARLEKTGIVSKEQSTEIGMVGMSARASNNSRDIRKSHPHDLYHLFNHKPIIKRHGDVYSRTQIRKEEILQSLDYIRNFMDEIPSATEKNMDLNPPAPNMFSLSLVEGWRGEICHCAITDEKGELMLYKIKDPSLHNWLALTLAVRNNEISDFPVCNKSFNLSYCGHDL